MRKHAIIVAGGSGTRMKSEIPKQFLELNGKPIIVHTIEKFLKIDDVQIILVLPKDHINFWEEIKATFFTKVKILVSNGGATRTESVLAGLNLVEEGLVAIHDAVRPFVTTGIIERTFESAKEFGSGVVAVKLKDSIREVFSEQSEARERENYVLVQTPQTFRATEIKEAYYKTSGHFTDDASVYEKAGFQVRLVEGDYSNIKITTPEDLK